MLTAKVVLHTGILMRNRCGWIHLHSADGVGNALRGRARITVHLRMTGRVSMCLIIVNLHLYLFFAAARAERMSIILTGGYRVTRSAIVIG